MRKIIYVLFVLTLCCFYKMRAKNIHSNMRSSQTINSSWKFKYCAEKNSEPLPVEYDDSDWMTVNIPHTWNMNYNSDTSSYRRGIGWYRKSLYLDNYLRGKSIFLHFEGANQIASIYVNGEHVGQHIGGYTGFTVDITKQVKFDNKDNLNIIAVKIDNRHNKNIPPLSADFTFYGGIYRDVWLTSVNPVHFDLMNMGSKGIFINTPHVSKNSAKVKVSGKIINSSNDGKNIEIVHRILDQNNKKVTVNKQNKFIKAKSQLTFDQEFTKIKDPELWSPDDPVLYKLQSEIYINDLLVDRLENNFGLRWFSFDPDRGFFLNGQQLKLIGTNRHQDRAGFGNALPNWAHKQDLKLIKENGFNFLRLAHYPQDPVVLETADKIGLIIWEEIPIVNYVTTSAEFKKNSKNMLSEMIRQHYNHPSVIMWGYMNEIFLHDVNGNRDKVYPEDYLEWTLDLANSLEDLLHKEDPYRISVMAIHHNDIYDEVGISKVPQVLGYNMYSGWYGGKFSSFGKNLDEHHEEFPDRCIMVSEYGAGSDERLNSLEPKRFDFTIEYQQLYHGSYIQQILDRDYLCGTAVWNQFDFGSDGRGDSKPKINQKGIFYYNREPKDISYLYKARLSEEPVIRIASRDFRERTARSGEEQLQPVKVYTNFNSIEFYLNGKLIGKKEVPENGIVHWQVNLETGENIVETVGYRNQRKYSDKLGINFQDYTELNHGFTEIAVNVGATNQFVDSGPVWLADKKYTEQSWGFIGGKEEKYKEAILGTDQEPLYQTFREGINHYKFDLPEGEYLVELCFVETSKENQEKRIFDIYINNRKVIDNMDLAKEFGYLRAVKRGFYTDTYDDAGLDIRFEEEIGKSILSGIKITKK